jgi:hypothetical protein
MSPSHSTPRSEVLEERSPREAFPLGLTMHPKQAAELLAAWRNSQRRDADFRNRCAEGSKN